MNFRPNRKCRYMRGKRTTTKTSVGNMLFLDVLNLEELGPYGLG